MQEVTKALLKARQEFQPIERDKVGQVQNRKYKYASLNSLHRSCLPALWANGLLVVHTFEQTDYGQVLSTHIMHDSGECLTSSSLLPHNPDPKQFGIEITYHRRYHLYGLLGVFPDEDFGGGGDNLNMSQGYSGKNPLPQTRKQPVVTRR